MIRWLRTTLNPASYHGNGKKPPFFEGWYYKLIDRSEQHRYAIIPGVFQAQDPVHSHAFIQVFDGQSTQLTYHTYPLEAFEFATGEFDIRIGANRFTTQHLALDIERDGQHVEGKLSFQSVQPWPVTLFSPGFVGWYAWVPFMQCYHGVMSLDHAIEGRLTVNQQCIDFNGGRGYSEKDWGRTFPASWVWLQSNHFARPGTSLTASVAFVPWIRKAFRGFVIGLWHKNRLYRFATYTGAWIEQLQITDEQLHWVVQDKRYRLDMQVIRSDNHGLLYAPETTGMHRRIAETLDATVAVQFSDLSGATAQLLWQDTGRHTGMEAVGDLHQLMTMA